MAKIKRRGKKERRGGEARIKEKEEEIQKGIDDGGEADSKGMGDI